MGLVLIGLDLLFELVGFDFWFVFAGFDFGFGLVGFLEIVGLVRVVFDCWFWVGYFVGLVVWAVGYLGL